MLAWLNPIDVFFQVPVGTEQVATTVQVVVEIEQAKRQDRSRARSQTRRDRFVVELHSPDFCHVQRGHLVGKVSNRDRHRTMVAERRDIDPHRPAGVPGGVKCDPGDRADVGEVAIPIVAEQDILHGVIGHDHIHEPLRQSRRMRHQAISKAALC